MDEIKENWNKIKEKVKEEYQLKQISYQTWIAPLKYYKEENNVVTIIIPSDNANAFDYIKSKYNTFFKIIISEFMDKEYDVKFVLENEIQDSEESFSDYSDNNVYNLKIKNANLNSKYNFESFVVGKNNKFAHSAALAVAESPGQAYNPLYLYGGPGLGKTHLMHSIGNYIVESYPDKKVIYVTSEQYMNEVIESIRSGSANEMTKLRDKYRNVDVLLIDDIQYIIGKDSTQEEFFHTFNVLHEAGKQIVISSDKPPKDLEKLDERFRSRFISGLITDIGAPEYETRVAILRKKAELFYINISDDVIYYIAENVTSNIRELEGSLKKVNAYSKIKKEEITLELAKNALEDIIGQKGTKEITPNYIIEVVAEHFSITSEDIISKKRNQELVLPRHIAMYLSREMTEVSLKKIGQIFGGRDHSTVLNAIDKIESYLNTGDNEIYTKIETIRKKLNPI